MRVLRVLCLGAVVACAGIGSAAKAGDYGPGGPGGPGGPDPAAAYYFHRHVHHQIYKLENFIAYTEANPDIDDAEKGRAIAWAHAGIHHLRKYVGLRRVPWPKPCCYTHRPIHLR